MAVALQSFTNRRNRKAGYSSEKAAAAQLRAMGFRMVEPIQTGWRVVRDRHGRIINAFPLEKVSGDIRAVAPGGRSVLVEVKERNRNLRWSDFQPHQREALDEHAALGGLSLVAWLYRGHFYVLPWPIPGFGPRKSISSEQGEQLTMREVTND